MFVERFFVEGLAHASYLFGKDGAAAVVDPRRDVDEYLLAAARRGAKIIAVFETHPHADFVSGHLELAERTGATIYVSEKLPARYPHQALKADEVVPVGDLRVQGLDTPGHSPDSMSFYVADGEDRYLFSGDVLFVGDVGRPDLRDMHADPRAMASALYDTLHEVLYRLPEETVVYPAHGAGSLCGRKLGSAPSTTIGAEKRANWANTFPTREEFVEAMVSNLPDRPLFFRYCPFVNLAGARALAEIPRARKLEPVSLLREDADALVLDTRGAAAYGAGHIEASLNVGLALPVFSTWVGTFVKPEQPLVLVVENPEAAEKARLELARIGYETIRGFLLADVSAWRAAGLPIRETPQIDACCAEPWLREGRALLDVRTPGERQQGHIPGAAWIPLSGLPQRLAEAPTGPLAVMCGSGYRSSIAASLLERAGWRQVVNLTGGWSAWAERQCAEPDAQDLFCHELLKQTSIGARRNTGREADLPGAASSDTPVTAGERSSAPPGQSPSATR
jgi:glyoxylase-like metal-dependent hydrolase (beta-lactamase superfamily II)/rhodanese-related sulfurtransferase